MKKKLKDKLGLNGRFRIITTDSITGEVKRTTPFYDNLVVDGTDTGFNLILDRLNGTNTYSLNITHLDIGTDNTAPALSDTDLIAGVARTEKATGVLSGSKITFRFFFASADLANDDYWEVGMFIDGSGTLGTGQLFNRGLFGSVYSKGTNEDSTIEWELSKIT